MDLREGLGSQGGFAWRKRIVDENYPQRPQKKQKKRKPPKKFR